MARYNLYVGAGTFLVETDEPPAFLDTDEALTFSLVNGRKLTVRARAVVAFEEAPQNKRSAKGGPGPTSVAYDTVSGRRIR